ncbi:hypothetical protein PR048_010031 [Dryococelus australis]|uniref:Transposase n=1 Tax=Dryococelus australis TaxID=614101 RepID=A0ABQ9I1K1_9NEOP|nr:hypothetical protein PR048_010031 [Dryococelus australis]
MPCFKSYYAVVRRQQCSLIGLARPEPRSQPYRTSLGRIGSPVKARQARPKSIAQLMEWLQEEWRRIPAEVTTIEQTLWTAIRVSEGTEQIGIQKSNAAAVPFVQTYPFADYGVAVAERLACPSPTKANRVQSPAGRLPNFRIWESCRTMPLVGGFSRASPDLGAAPDSDPSWLSRPR